MTRARWMWWLLVIPGFLGCGEHAAWVESQPQQEGASTDRSSIRAAYLTSLHEEAARNPRYQVSSGLVAENAAQGFSAKFAEQAIRVAPDSGAWQLDLGVIGVGCDGRLMGIDGNRAPSVSGERPNLVEYAYRAGRATIT